LVFQVLPILSRPSGLEKTNDKAMSPDENTAPVTETPEMETPATDAPAMPAEETEATDTPAEQA